MIACAVVLPFKISASACEPPFGVEFVIERFASAMLFAWSALKTMR